MGNLTLPILILLATFTFFVGHNVLNAEKEQEVNISHSYNCTLTAYSATVDQTDSDPHVTALMERPVVGGTVAVSHDLKRYLGNKVYISGHGVFRVNDLMNKRYSKRIDLFVKDRQTAINFGKKEDVLVVFY